MTGNRLPTWIVPVLIATAVTVFAQRWSGLDTPDSSFYATLSLFGDQVTERAPIASYYWTRVGYIAPVAALTSIFGAFPGFAVYKFVLTVAIAVSAYVLARRYAKPWVAAWLTAAVITSTVILSYLGNPYLTGTILAGTSILVALGSTARPTRISAIVAGATMGWVAMVNPPGALLAGTLWLVLVLNNGASSDGLSRVQQLLLALPGFFIVVAAFVIIGTAMFPSENWISTYTSALGIDQSNYSSSNPIWLTDISLLVPTAVMVICVVSWLGNRSSRPAQQGLVISCTSIAFALVFSLFMGGVNLESPMYQAMLWPPALLALSLAVLSRLQAGATSRNYMYVLAAGGIAAIVATGFIAPRISFIFGIGLAVAMSALVLASRGITAVVLSVSTFLVGAQLLQNSRGDLGLYYLSPYHWAYASNPIETKMRTAVNSQEWLLENTGPSDQILIWVDGPWTQGDRELYVAAGMQLWGENRITLEPTLTDDYGLNQLATIQPDVLALYGKSMDSVMAFWNSIPKANDPSAPICYDYSWQSDSSSDFPTTQGHTCLTRLTWERAESA